ncbi:hypothetical protein BJX64DRAFT_279351 [Aspergillus heterothallicus]
METVHRILSILPAPDNQSRATRPAQRRGLWVEGLSRNESIYSNLSAQAYYLDSSLWATQRIPDGSAPIPVPDEISAALGGLNGIQSIIAAYFQTVHFYLPFTVEGSTKVDIALLLLCMKLVQEIPKTDDPQSLELYHLAKGFSTKAEAQGVSTLHMLQANILLLLYEVGQGIFPAAFMTVGHCARQGTALGLFSRHAPQLASKPQSWVDFEERHRVRLSRYVALGGCHRPFCTADPASDTTRLPVEDGAWNNGQIVPPEPISLESYTNPAGISPFARVAQASHLLGQVLKHCAKTPIPTAQSTLEDKFNQLTQQIYAFIDVLHNHDPFARLDVTVARTICFSALFTLCNHTTLQLLYRCLEIVDDIRALVSTLVNEIRGLITEESMKIVSPLILNCLYVCARNAGWMVRETSGSKLGGVKGECVELLRLIGSRWRVAGELIFPIS